MKSPIFQSFNQDRSTSGNDDICINLYPELVEGPKGPVIGSLFGTPCPLLLGSVGTGPGRGGYIAANGVLYVVSGMGFYSVDTNWVGTKLGQLGTLAGPVSMIGSPTQVLVVDGAAGWCWNFVANTWKQVIPNGDTDDVGPNVAIYQDGFGLVNSLNSNQIYQSNYNDLSAFAALNGNGGATANNAFVQTTPKNVLTMFDLDREAWIFKGGGIEVWVNEGNPGFAFAQLQGVYLQSGIVASASVARLGAGLAWLGQDEKGPPMVMQSLGYKADSITPFALSAIFQSYAVVSDAISYSYQESGHRFYVITFPTEGVTWCYDATTHKWHQRAYFSQGNYSRELANCFFFYNGTKVVGDYQNGNLYELSSSTYTDNGQPRKWMRSWSALPDGTPKTPMTFDSLEIFMETGITVAPGANPQVDFEWSDDGGYTWAGPFQVAAGEIGQTGWRVVKNRCGSTKIGTGLDRVWRISGNDPIAIKINDAQWEGGPA